MGSLMEEADELGKEYQHKRDLEKAKQEAAEQAKQEAKDEEKRHEENKKQGMI